MKHPTLETEKTHSSSSLKNEKKQLFTRMTSFLVYELIWLKDFKEKDFMLSL